MNQCVFVNTDQQPKSVRHICWYTADGGSGTIKLCEVIEEEYPHPDCPVHATVRIIRTKCIKTFLRSEFRAAPAIVMEAAQRLCVLAGIPL